MLQNLREKQKYQITNVEKIKISRLLEFKINEIRRKTPQ